MSSRQRLPVQIEGRRFTGPLGAIPTAMLMHNDRSNTSDLRRQPQMKRRRDIQLTGGRRSGISNRPNLRVNR